MYRLLTKFLHSISGISLNCPISDSNVIDLDFVPANLWDKNHLFSMQSREVFISLCFCRLWCVRIVIAGECLSGARPSSSTLSTSSCLKTRGLRSRSGISSDFGLGVWWWIIVQFVEIISRISTSECEANLASTLDMLFDST